MIRQPIICVMGHVDHGKTTLLDRIRNTTMAAREAGGITQHIGASEVPIDVIEKLSGSLLRKFGAKITIPGLLFIDTPGHEAFTNLRRRGGAVADLAILVIDISKNFEPQTYEALEILKEYKTPFIIAANKIDTTTGWRPSGSHSFTEAMAKQSPGVAEAVDSKLYEIIGKLSEAGFSSERFDRVTDFKKEIVIVPLSAKTGEGIAELLMYATGLAQRFLEMRLETEVKGPGRGSILEKKEDKGLGSTIDVILYNGSLKVNDIIAFATTTGIGRAKIKALLKPKPLQEMRDTASKYYYVDSVAAATGVKISGSGLEDALSGSLVLSAEVPNYESEIKSELTDIFSTDKKGIILKADTMGSMEALSRLLKAEAVGAIISKKSIGNVAKRDVLDAFAMRAIDPNSAVVLAFNVTIDQEASQESEAAGITIISSSIIYKLIDDYREWEESQKKMDRAAAEKALIFPGAVTVLPNSAFRISHPAIFGIKVEAGRIKPSYLMMNKQGEIVGRIKEVQNNGMSLQEAKKGESVAVSMDDVTFGRQVRENEVLYTFMNDENERLLRYKFDFLLDDQSKELLEELSRIKELNRPKPV